MQEIWIPWIIDPVLDMYNYLEEIIEYESCGLTIIYHHEDNDNQKFKIIFKNPVYVFRHGNESFRFLTLDREDKCYDNVVFKRHTTFKIQNSIFLALALEGVVAPIDKSKLTHFLFGTTDELLDIIASEEPVFETYYQAKE